MQGTPKETNKKRNMHYYLQEIAKVIINMEFY